MTAAPSSARELTRFLLIAAALALFLWVAWELRFLAAPAVLGVFIYYCLVPLVNLLESRRLARWAAVTCACLAVLLGLLTLSLLLGPSLAAWLHEPPNRADSGAFERRLTVRLADWETALDASYPRIDWRAGFAELRMFIADQKKQLTETLPTLAWSALSNAGTFLLAPIFAIVLLLDGAGMRKAVVQLVPNRHFETALVLLHRVDRQIAGYLRGAASESALVFVLLGVVLYALGMPHALGFAGLYALANVVPVAGPVLSTAAGLLFALLDPAAPSLGLLFFAYAAVYVLDAAFINPLVVGKNLNMHPLTVVLGISIGGNLAGVLGMLAAIPVIAIGRAILGTLLDQWRENAASGGA